MLCLRCNDLYPDDESRCPRCRSELVQPNFGQLKLYLDSKFPEFLRSQIDDWERANLINQHIARRLRATVPFPVAPMAEDPLERQSTQQSRVTPTTEPTPAQPTYDSEDNAVDAGREMFHADGTGLTAATGAIAALAALDEMSPPKRREKKPSYWSTEVWPVLYENIGWFIGALFVLAGSVYGVREAWIALGDAAKHAVVAGALFTYHAAFTGVAALLTKRSESAGRVLGAIAAGLLPMSFAALGGLWGETITGGLLLTLVMGGLSVFTLGSIGRRFEFGPFELATVLLPSLLAQLPLAAGSDLTATLPFIGVGCLAWSLRSTEGNRRHALALFAAYGAVALQITALVVNSTLDATDWAALLLRLMLVGAAGAITFGREAWRTKWPHLAPSLETASLGLAATTAVAATLSSNTAAAGIHALTTLLTAILFAMASRRHPRAVHITALAGAASAYSFGFMLSGESGGGFTAIALVAALGLQATRLENKRLRTLAVRWSTLFTLVGTVWVTVVPLRAFDAGCVVELTYTHVIVAALAMTVSAISAGRFQYRGLHYLASYGLLVATSYWWRENGPVILFDLTLALVLSYSLAGIAFDVLALRFGADASSKAMKPYEDVALLSLLLLIPIGTSQPETKNLTLVITGVGFLYRAWRDQTRLLSALGASLLAYRAYLELPPTTQSVGLVVLGCVAVASLRGLENVRDGIEGRRLFGSLALPSAAPLRVLLSDGFAAAAFLGAGLVVLQTIGWTALRPEEQRPTVVLGMLTIAGSVLVAFLTPAFHSVRARGHVATLSLLAMTIAFTGILNRLGRPLPPLAVAERLTGISIGVWLLAGALRRWGPRLGKWLGNEQSGRLYHFVPHGGVAVLATVLAVDASLVSANGLIAALTITPPLLWFGAATSIALLARSAKSAEIFGAALALMLLGSPLVANQHTMLGFLPDPSRALPTGWWLFGLETAQAQQGLALAALLFGGISAVLARGGTSLAESAAWFFLDDRIKADDLRKQFSIWGTTAANLILIIAWVQPTVPSASIAIAAGVFASIGRRRSGAATAVLSMATLLHAYAQSMPQVPMWAGPSITALGLLLVIVSPFAAKRVPNRVDVTHRSAHQLAKLLFVMGTVYSLAADGPTDAIGAALAVGLAAWTKAANQWLTSEALVASLLLIAVSTLFMGAQAKAKEWNYLLGPTRASTVLLFALAIIFGLPETAAVATHALPDPIPSLGLLTYFLFFGWQLAPALALIAVATQYANRWNTGTGDDHSAGGLRFGRDVVLVLVAFFVTASVVYPASIGTPRDGQAVSMAFLALVGLAGVSAHTAWREQTSRHVYAVQLTAVGIYGLVRTQFFRETPPELDACFALALGFVLLGVTVLSRRAGIPPVAVATRRFAALLPFAIPFIMPFEASYSTALLAAGSGVLWAALGWAERNRVFGSLGAAAMNLALLASALTAGMDGIEIYVAPVGLMILALGQIFSDSLTPGSKQIVRILGSLLIYLPAAAQLSLQVGAAQDGSYAIGFGLACLVGIAAGMLLHIRAYLALGTGFLVLDVVSNLVHASLRDHRIGFVVLSLAGISILSVMIFITLQREYVQRMANTWRARLAGWE